ncbi:hypothetical protein DFH27DRAFT_627782 [Peziza echinospora]|nr:hypothetical protein DFH27DRAFT_627782 [Peziza echinospora]
MSDSDSHTEKDKVLKLKGAENYHVWIRLIKIKLAGKGLLEISTYQKSPEEDRIAEDDYNRRLRNDPKPDQPRAAAIVVEGEPAPAPLVDAVVQAKYTQDLAKWNKRFYRATSVILGAIHPNIQGEIDAFDDPAQILIELGKLYKQEEISTEVDLREQLSNLKFDFHTSADDFFAKIQRILNRLNECHEPSFQPYPRLPRT